jgi:hypothetical protein
MLTDEYAGPIEIVWRGQPVTVAALTVLPHKDGGRRIVAADTADRFWLLREAAGVLSSEPACPPVGLKEAVDAAINHLSGHSHGSVQGEGNGVAIALLAALAQTGRLA